QAYLERLAPQALRSAQTITTLCGFNPRAVRREDSLHLIQPVNGGSGQNISSVFRSGFTIAPATVFARAPSCVMRSEWYATGERRAIIERGRVWQI
ncbi:MAG: hypothetical protein ACREQA_11430, partial [Candidatus Binatia bacterium]